MVIPTTNGETRQDILRAALKRFAHGGYAATSVQQIVGDAKVSKPTLYYYFTDKADLFQALVNEAHDERYRRMQSAVKRAKEVRLQLVEILAVLFDYFRDNRELMRISLATAFALGKKEAPPREVLAAHPVLSLLDVYPDDVESLIDRKDEILSRARSASS